MKINIEPENDGLEDDFFLFYGCVLKFHVNLLGCNALLVGTEDDDAQASARPDVRPEGLGVLADPVMGPGASGWPLKLIFYKYQMSSEEI